MSAESVRSQARRGPDSLEATPRAPFFVDSNVLIYAHDRSAGSKHEAAKALIEGLWEDRAGCLSVQVLQEFFVNVTRKVRSPLGVAEAQQVISDLSYWKVHRPDAFDVLAAIDIHRRTQISFWDAMIVKSAAAQSCNVLYSEDLGDGQVYEGVRVKNPIPDGGA